MIPFPPLDGSKVLAAILPFGAAQKYRELTMIVERYGIIVLFIFIFIAIQFIWPYLFTAVLAFGSLLTGLPALELLDFLRF